MKIRGDFVTNSSSSSFVIGKKDDASVTVEMVYHLIKEFYTEYLERRDILLKYIKENPEFGVKYSGGHFDFTNCDRFSQKGSERDKTLKRDFGITTWDYFDCSYDWMSCETYQDYVNYWVNQKEYGNDYDVHAPFSIADFINEYDVEWVHDGFREPNCINSESDVLSWYYPYIEEAFKNIDCDKCGRLKWCDKDECQEEKTLVNGNNIPENKACLYLLGRVCVYSECGYISDYVVEKLSDISECYCNHMG